MSPISKFTILALASTVLAVPYAGQHGHFAHGHLHQRGVAPAVGGDNAVNGSTPVATEEAAPSSFDSPSSIVAEAQPATSSAAAAEVPPSYNAPTVSSVADGAAASSAPEYSYAPVVSSEASGNAPPAYVSSDSVADATPATSSVVEYSYDPVESSEASAVVPSTSCTSSEGSPVSTEEVSASVPPTYQSISTVEQDASVPVQSSSAAASVPAAYPTVESSEAQAVPTAYPSAESSADLTSTKTIKTTRTTTLFTTVYLTSSSSQPAPVQTEEVSANVPAQPAPAPSSNAAQPSGPALTAAAEQCAVRTVTETKKVTQYVTVTPGASSQAVVTQVVVPQPAGTSLVTVKITSTVYNNPNYQAPTSSAQAAYSTKSSAAAPVPTSSEASASVPVYVIPSSSEASAVPTKPASAPAYEAPVSSQPASASAPVAPVYSAPASSSEAAAIIPPSYASVDSAAPSSAVSSAAASSTPSAPASYTPSSGGKRGLAYNDASLTTCLADSEHVSWGYNWASSRDGLSSNLKFIPTLWGTRSDFTSVWDANVKQCIADGSEWIFSFNEPDHNEQASMTPAAAAQAYQTYMNPLKGQAKLCAPSVTNGGGSMGLTWLQSFLDSCGSNCAIDCLNVHWYDSASNVEYFKSHIQQAIDMANGKPIFVSEFGATGSNEEIAAFLQEVMPWMDGNSAVAGYAYFMVKEGDLVTGGEPSSYGNTYKTFSS